MNLYHYRATLLRVVDGDTIDVSLDMGFNTWCSQRLRLLDVDTPERSEPGWAEATSFTASSLLAGSIVVNTVKRDSFGRWLAKVWVDGVLLNDAIREFLALEGYGKVP